MDDKAIWEELTYQISQCKRCKVCSNGEKKIVGSGSMNAKIMFVGEAPTEEEVVKGLPFVGKSGQLFDKILHSVELTREDIYITNIIKCAPENHRLPDSEELEICSDYLKAQIALLNPKIIVPVGSVASDFFVKDKTSLTLSKFRGEIFEYQGDIKVIPIFHPNYLLRKPGTAEGSPKFLTWKDMILIKDMYNEIKEKA